MWQTKTGTCLRFLFGHTFEGATTRRVGASPLIWQQWLFFSVMMSSSPSTIQLPDHSEVVANYHLSGRNRNTTRCENNRSFCLTTSKCFRFVHHGRLFYLVLLFILFHTVIFSSHMQLNLFLCSLLAFLCQILSHSEIIVGYIYILQIL